MNEGLVQTPLPTEPDYTVVQRRCLKCRRPVGESGWCADCELHYVVLRGVLGLTATGVAFGVMAMIGRETDPMDAFNRTWVAIVGVALSVGYASIGCYLNRSRKKRSATNPDP